MIAELAIYRQDDVISCVLLEDGRPAERLTDDGGKTPRRQDIWLGRIQRVLPALSCVFVDIGDTHDAMLPLGEAPEGAKPGQPLIIQIRRETAAGKGQQVTTRISLPGAFAVFNPFGPPKHRSKLAAFPENEQRRLYADDLRRLQNIWRQLQVDSQSGQVPRCLLPLGQPLRQALLMLVSPELVKIRVEGDDLFSSVYSLIQELMPPYLPLLELHVPAAGYGLAAALGLSSLPENVRQRKVWLDSGAYLVIDQTEALTVIDVNSGKDVRGTAHDELRRRTNLQAAREIARQLRLRNLSGGIVIDFLNMDETARGELASAMQDELDRDRARCKLLGFTNLGLLEMTRTAR